MTWRSIGELAAQIVANVQRERRQRFDSTDEYATEMRRAEGVFQHSASALTRNDHRRVE